MRDEISSLACVTVNLFKYLSSFSDCFKNHSLGQISTVSSITLIQAILYRSSNRARVGSLSWFWLSEVLVIMSAGGEGAERLREPPHPQPEHAVG